jgi:hypothetical protein
MLVAWSTNVAIISGFVASALTVLVVLAAYGRPSDGVWRIGFGIGAVVCDLLYRRLITASSCRFRVPASDDELQAIREARREGSKVPIPAGLKEILETLVRVRHAFCDYAKHTGALESGSYTTW